MCYRRNVIEMAERIVEAAARLLQDEGPQALTTRRVAAAAETQGPTIYRLFGDKDGLLNAVAQHVLATYVATKTVASALEEHSSATRDPVADLRAAFLLHLDFGLANPHLFAILSAPGRDASLHEDEGRGVLRERVRRVAAAGLLRVSEDRAVQMISAAGNGAVLITLGLPVAERDPGLGVAMFDAVALSILVSRQPTSDVPMAAQPKAITAAISLAASLPELHALTESEQALMNEWLNRSIAALQN
jgi:AcrR family transcriptional regulator